MKKYKRYFFIEKRIREKGFDPDRHELIGIFTQRKKNRIKSFSEAMVSTQQEKHSLKDLSEAEYREFLTWLTTKFDIHNETDQERKAKMDKMRKKLIALFIHQMGYSYHGLDNWLLTKGVVKKTLNQLSYADLVKTISQAEIVYQSHLKSISQ